MQDEIDRLKANARPSSRIGKIVSRWPVQYTIEEAQKIAYTAIERLYPDAHRHGYDERWIEEWMYR